jgi:uncharacterized protein YraI
MIEVTGRDGRVHSFADGTTDAQIDAAMAAIYNAEPAPRYEAPPYRAPQSRGRLADQKGTLALLGGAFGVVVLGGLAMYVLGDGADKPMVSAVQTHVDPTPTAGAVTAVPAPEDSVAPVPPAGPSVTPEAFAGFVATKQGGNVTVRAQAQPTGAQIAKLPHGAPISVTGSVVMPDGLWRQVSVGGATGFVKGDYISQTQPAAIVRAPLVEVKMIPRDFWGFATTRDNDGNVNVRASPNLNATVTSTIPSGASVYVVGEQSGWFLVEWKGKRGWANTDYVSREYVGD